MAQNLPTKHFGRQKVGRLISLHSIVKVLQLDSTSRVLLEYFGKAIMLCSDCSLIYGMLLGYA